MVVVDRNRLCRVRLGVGANSTLWRCRSLMLDLLSRVVVMAMHGSITNSVRTAVVMTVVATTHTIRAGSGRVVSAGAWTGI